MDQTGLHHLFSPAVVGGGDRAPKAWVGLLGDQRVREVCRDQRDEMLQVDQTGPKR